MCGITGMFNLNGEPASPVILRRMTDAITHRGPDGEGFYVDSFLALGHRRLAIIDLSPSGHQPMVTREGMYAITYNGEVYNFNELRVKLESLGHQFHSKSDTEVVLKSYVEWGEKCIDKFNGMFAFAIWDKKNQELFLARDRYGIKPLYYTLQGKTLLFASEVKAILQHPAYRIGINKQALVEYFTFQNFFTSETLYKSVKMLPAGNYLRIQLACTAEPVPVQYWDFDFSEAETYTNEREYIEELDRLFKQAVNRQLVSDVELGSYLSGGMDSGALTSIAAKQLPYLKTFTCGFDLSSASGMELGFDERQKAEMMSYRFKTEHYEMVLKAGDMERIMSDLVWHIEEPRVGQSYPNYYAAKLASKFVKVVLSGCGGDELFGGYPWRYYRAASNKSFDDYIDKYYNYWQRLIPNNATQRVFAPIWNEVKDVSTENIFRSVFAARQSEPHSPEEYINHSLYLEAKTFLHGLFTVEDKISMAHSLETRVPFLDNDLVDFAMRLPVRYKLAKFEKAVRINENETGDKSNSYYLQTNDGKVLFRKAMMLHVPHEIYDARKQGFSAPDASWFKGESMKYVEGQLFNGNAVVYQYLDKKIIQSLVGEHLNGIANHRLLIWSLLYFEKWCSTFLR